MKQLRERAGLSQGKLSKIMNVSASSVQKWDQGITFPQMKPREMKLLMDTLNCSWDELIEAQENFEVEQQ